jgi:GDPmannose 4,6-dehydratase
VSKTAFITGVTGQDGAYLAKLLLDKGYEVHGGVRRVGVDNLGRLRELGVLDRITLHDFDLIEFSNVRRKITEIQPDELYNLAAQSFVGTSFEQPIYTAQTDSMGPLYILEVLRENPGKTRMFQASTSEMFGKVQAIPQLETTPFYPRSPYGVAKLFAHWMMINYRESYGMFCASAIAFNHESPLRGREFVTRKVTLGLAEVFAGKRDCVELGNLDAKRDWGFAGDYVEGMWRMLQADQPDDYVLATGETHSIRDFIEGVAAFHGRSVRWSGEREDEVGVDETTGKTIIRVNPKFYRPAEVDLLIGDPSKVEQSLGWKRSVDFRGLVDMMAAADRDRIEKGVIPF